MYVSVSAFVFFVIMSSYTAQLTGASRLRLLAVSPGADTLCAQPSWPTSRFQRRTSPALTRSPPSARRCACGKMPRSRLSSPPSTRSSRCCLSRGSPRRVCCPPSSAACARAAWVLTRSSSTRSAGPASSTLMASTPHVRRSCDLGARRSISHCFCAESFCGLEIVGYLLTFGYYGVRWLALASARSASSSPAAASTGRAQPTRPLPGAHVC